MVSVFSHIAIGILAAEIILYLKFKDSMKRRNNRLVFWSFGFLGGMIPDLDVIPALIIGVHYYEYHHIYTHTFLALGIVAIIFVLFRKTNWALPLFVGFGLHLVADFIDNSISPFGPFLPSLEWGLMCGWGELPGGNWAAEYWLYPWLYPGTENHHLWTIFLTNGWGIPIGTEFLSYYDLVFIGIFFLLFILYIIVIVDKVVNRNQVDNLSKAIKNEKQNINFF